MNISDRNWSVLAIGVNRPKQNEVREGAAPVALRGAERDAERWCACMRRHAKLHYQRVICGKDAKWQDGVSEELDALTKSQTLKDHPLLITFSGMGCKFSWNSVGDASPDEVEEEAICLSDQVVTPSQLKPRLRTLSNRFVRVVLLIDAAFYDVENAFRDEQLMSSAIDYPQYQYAPLKTMDSALLPRPPKLEQDDSYTYTKRWLDLARTAGVEVLVADRRFAWETSDSRRDANQRQWQGVFSFAAQEAMEFGMDHWPWKNLAVTKRLIPRLYFPQTPVHRLPDRP